MYYQETVKAIVAVTCISQTSYIYYLKNPIIIIPIKIAMLFTNNRPTWEQTPVVLFKAGMIPIWKIADSDRLCNVTTYKFVVGLLTVL